MTSTMSALQTGERVNRIEYYNALMNQLLTIGESMLTSGAGVNKVEETLAAIGRAYGASRMDVFVITSCAIVTMYPEDSCAVTQTRRILSPGSPNFSRVEAYSKLSKECERTPITLEELTDRVESIVSRQYPEKLIYLGSVLAAGGFAVFFGGTHMDGILAAAAGAFVCYCQRRLAWISPNQVVYLFLCALCAGFVISAMGAAFPAVHPDMIMIGDIMLLIPGVAMTHSVRDILAGDTISGFMRLLETIVWAGALACGFMIPMWLI